MKKIPPKPSTRGVPPLRSAVDRVLAMIAKHGTPAAAIDAMKIAGEDPPPLRTVYRWVEARRRDPAWGTLDSAKASTTHADDPPASPPPLPVVVRPPEGLSPRALERWYIERQIDDVRQALALVQQNIARGDLSSLSRVASLNGSLESWLNRLAKLSPKDEHDPIDDAATRWKTAAESARKKILDGCADARERMGALLGRPFPYAVDVVADRSATSAP